jgi:glutamyl-tRNA synthetase
VNEQRKKLSKRRDDVSVADYKDRGFLPEAMRNYLALLGWGPPDGIEVRPIEQIVDLFRLEDVNPSPAFFDVKKLTHINGEYIRALAVDDFVARASEYVADADERAAVAALAPLIQERAKTLTEVSAYVDWVHGPVDDPRAWDKAMKPPLASAALDGAYAAFTVATWTVDDLHAAFIDLAEGLEAAPRKIDGPLRVAVTGRTVGPPLFDVFVHLGRDETLARLRAARERLSP